MNRSDRIQRGILENYYLTPVFRAFIDAIGPRAAAKKWQDVFPTITTGYAYPRGGLDGERVVARMPRGSLSPANRTVPARGTTMRGSVDFPAYSLRDVRRRVARATCGPPAVESMSNAGQESRQAESHRARYDGWLRARFDRFTGL